MNKLLFLLLNVFLIQSVLSQSEQLSIDSFFERQWKIIQADKTYEDPANYLSEAHFLEKKKNLETILIDLAEYKDENLSRENQINKSIFAFILEDRIAHIDQEAFLIPLNAEGGFYNWFAYEYERTIYKTEKEVSKGLDRMNKFDDVVSAYIKLMRIGMEKGKVMPAAILVEYEKTIEPYFSIPVLQTSFYKPFNNLPDDFPNKDKFQNEAKFIIANTVQVAYKQFYDFMKDEYIPNARKTIGLSEVPGGKAWYDQRVAFFTTLPLSSDDIYNMGLEEVARIRSQMEEIIEQVGFKGNFTEFLTFLRTDEQFYAKTPQELLNHAAWLSKKAEGQLPKFFGKLPRLPFTVEPVPAAIAPRYTGGRYSSGSVKQGRAGAYWVNTYKLESRPLYVLPALTLHEAVPGHHLQISLAAEIENMPTFRRQTYLSCYGEGWGLYSEFLGQEMGMYSTPYEDFGRLTYEMWRACRLVVDVGMHAKGWTREAAVEYMASNTALSIHEVNTEINRYIGWPAQALSYKIGELKIRELRKRAEEEMGDGFDIKAFHDLILSFGSVPLFILEQEVDLWIKNK